jgi:hypothetical protein
VALSEQLEIRPFEVGDQEAAKQLVVTGLGERWGWIDPTLNPDLNDIATTYRTGIFLVGYLNDLLVATGALMPEVTPEGLDVLRVVRMSVRAGESGGGCWMRCSTMDARWGVARLS